MILVVLSKWVFIEVRQYSYYSVRVLFFPALPLLYVLIHMKNDHKMWPFSFT
jgi:hypothetical protein